MGQTISRYRIRRTVGVDNCCNIAISPTTANGDRFSSSWCNRLIAAAARSNPRKCLFFQSPVATSHNSLDTSGDFSRKKLYDSDQRLWGNLT
jgi:hypothetical protein